MFVSREKAEEFLAVKCREYILHKRTSLWDAAQHMDALRALEVLIDVPGASLELVLRQFWNELFERSDVDDALGKVLADRLKRRLHHIEKPNEVRISHYGFHEVVARGPMYDYERKKLLLEYLTPSEVKRYDVPIPGDVQPEKIGEPRRIAYRRFAKDKGIDPDDHEAVEKAFRAEALRRFEEKERIWARGARSMKSQKF